MHPWQRIEAAHDRRATCREFLNHALDRFLRPFERRDGGLLAEARRAADRIRDQTLHVWHKLSREYPKAESPAGHRPGLGPAIEQDRAIEHAIQRGDRLVLARIQDP